MDQQNEAFDDYPHGRGYGHDYMRGGEVFGGYGYAERDEFAKTRGELQQGAEGPPGGVEDASETDPGTSSG